MEYRGFHKNLIWSVDIGIIITTIITVINIINIIIIIVVVVVVVVVVIYVDNDDDDDDITWCSEYYWIEYLKIFNKYCAWMNCSLNVDLKT
jgi:hypothetical protein